MVTALTAGRPSSAESQLHDRGAEHEGDESGQGQPQGDRGKCPFPVLAHDLILSAGNAGVAT